MTDRDILHAARVCGVPPEATLVPVPRTGTSAQVWRVDTGGPPGWLKLPGSARAFEAEARALALWAPGMDARTPRVIGAHAEAPWALLLTDIDGTPVSESAPPVHVLERAGRALGSLHRLPYRDNDPVPLDEALDARWAACRARASRAGIALDGSLSDAWSRRPRTTRRRVPTHRDFAPRNWVWSDDDGLGVIDFGVASADHPWWDLVPLLLAETLDGPGATAAFERGYGAPLPGDDAELAGLILLYSVATVVWAAEHGDTTHARIGWRGLARLGLVTTQSGDGFQRAEHPRR